LLQLDITDLANILAAWQHFMKEYGGLDVLINNSRIAPRRNYTLLIDMCNELLPLHVCSPDLQLVALMKCFVAEAKAGDHVSKGWPNSDTPERIQLNPCCPGWVKSEITYTNGTWTPAEGLDTPVHQTGLPNTAESLLHEL
uniref:Carbonyl reductase 1 n=1 Tax=Salmo trutta TaxID=8032 RepID=A0A673XBK2_SALTR